MTNGEKIRIAYTYLMECVDLVDIKEMMVQRDAGDIWGDIKCGSLSTEKTGAMKKHVRELQTALSTLNEHIEEIDHQIR